MDTPFDVQFEAGGKTYSLRYTIGAIVTIENRLNKSFGQLAEDMQDPKTLRIGTVREMLHAGLKYHHPRISLEDAGELMLAAGGIGVILPSIANAITAAFPEQEGGSQGTQDPLN